jgi:hypothetical protein
MSCNPRSSSLEVEKPLRYPYGWALAVVQRLYNAHARATDIVCHVYKTSTKQLAFWLASDATAWNYLKARVHEAGKLTLKSLEDLTDVELLWLSERFSCHIGPDFLLQRLDSVKRAAHISRAGYVQGVLGGSGKANAAESSELSPVFI